MPHPTPDAQVTPQAAQFRKVAECLYRHESSGNYYALVKRSRKQYRRSLKTKDRKLAERKLADFRQKVGQLSLTASASQITFSDIAARWLESLKPTLKTSSFERRETSVGMLRPYFGALSLRQVSSRPCEDWASRRSPKIAASTYNNERDTLTAILSYAKREGLILDNPASVLQRRKQPRVEIVIPTKPEFGALVRQLRSMDSRYQDAANLVELLAYSGMRLSEAASLRWRDVQFDGEKFVVTGGAEGTKNHEVRTVPLFPAMRSLLERMAAPRRPGRSRVASSSCLRSETKVE